MSRTGSATSFGLCALLLAPLAGAQLPPFGDLHLPPATDEVSTLSLAAADLDGDGDLDLVEGSWENELLENQGSAVFTVGGALPWVKGATTSGLAWADLDGDGDPDLLTSQSLGLPVSPPVALFVNQGAFAFTDETASSIPLPPVEGGSQAIALGDVDGDGDLDAYVGNQPVGYNDGHNYLLLGDGAGGFLDATTQLPYDAWETQALALGDVDGDGDPDAVLANGLAPCCVQANALQRNDGKGVFSEDPSALPAVVESTTAVALHDLDGDGDLDVVFANGMVAATGALVANNLFLGDGAGGFVDASAQLGSELLDSQAVLLADLDGDLDADLVVGEGGEVPDTVRWNDGSATFHTWPPSPGVPSLDETTRSLGIADLDGDGRVDVLVGHGGGDSPALRLLLGDPYGYFTDDSGLLPSPWLWGSFLATGVADLDGDGDLDAYLGTGDDDHLWFGLARHLAWRHAPRLGKPLDMDVWGPPLEAFSLGWALAPGYTPLPPLGTLLLDRATLEHAASGVLDAEGRGTVTFLVPQNPGLAGVDVLWQAAVGDAFVRLTNLERTTASAF